MKDETINATVGLLVILILVVGIVLFIQLNHKENIEVLKTICEDQGMNLTDYDKGQYPNPHHNRTYYETRYKVECDGKVQHQTYRISIRQNCIEWNKWGNCKEKEIERRIYQ